MTTRRRWGMIIALTLLGAGLLAGPAPVDPNASSLRDLASSTTARAGLFCPLPLFRDETGEELIYTVTDRATLLNLARRYGWDPPEGNGIISRAVFVVDSQALPSTAEDTAPLQSQSPGGVALRRSALGYFIRHKGDGMVGGDLVLRHSYYQGPSIATMTVREPVPAEWRATGGVNARVVSAGVGFDVAKSYAVSESHTVSVPAGRMLGLVAYPIYYLAQFDVYYDPVIGGPFKVGNGYAMKLVGIYFVEYIHGWM